MKTANTGIAPKQTRPAVSGGAQAELSKVMAAAESYAAASSAEEGISSAAPRLSVHHMFRRIAAIVSAENRAKEMTDPVYARNKYFFSRNKMPDGQLTEEQSKEITDFWAPYSFAYKNDPDTQRYFSLVSGHFDPSYISPGLHYLFLRKYWNIPKAAFLTDKNNTDLLFPDVKTPGTIFRRIEGNYYDASRSPLSESEAQEMCLDIVSRGRPLVLRPAQGGEKKGTAFLRPDKGRMENEKIFKSTGYKDYICQTVTESHESWRYASCKGMNTAQINTICLDGKAEIITSYLKISVNKINNADPGTWAVPINGSGILGEFAIDEASGKKHFSFPDGSDFSGRKLFNYEKVKETVLMMAGRVPELKAAAWDMTVDAEGNVNFIELNICGGTKTVQSQGMPLYGGKEKLKAILDEYLIKRFCYERADWEWDYWEFKNTVSIHKYDGLKKVVRIPEKLRGKPVTAIHANAFSGKGLEKIIVPKSVKIISENAFAGCGKNCEIVLPFSQKLCVNTYKTIKKLPYGSRLAETLKKYWLDSKVLKIKSLRSVILQRLSQRKK